MAAVLDSRSNSITNTSTYAGKVSDEHEANYMTKEGASFKYATSMMLTAIDHIARYRSVTPDTGCLRRTGTHVATHCQRFCERGHEWSLRVMAHALVGCVSFESSDSHWFIYPHDCVTFAAQEHGITEDAAGLNDIERALGDLIAEMDKDDE